LADSIVILIPRGDQRHVRQHVLDDLHSRVGQAAMKPWHAMTNPRSARRMLAWSVLIAMTVVLALLFQAFAANALVPSGAAAGSAACHAALSTGHDVRESFLAHVCGGAGDGTSRP
jgi:hypothetical protein